MNSIARALNNIAISITNLTAAVVSLTSKKVEEVKQLPAPKTQTSNGLGHVTITSAIMNTSPITNDSSKPSFQKHEHNPSTDWVPKKAIQKVVVFKEEKEAIDAIVKAVTDKGINPKFHDKMMAKLKEEWPVLFDAVNRLVVVNKKYYNPKSYTSSKDIWKSTNEDWGKNW